MAGVNPAGGGASLGQLQGLLGEVRNIAAANGVDLNAAGGGGAAPAAGGTGTAAANGTTGSTTREDTKFQKVAELKFNVQFDKSDGIAAGLGNLARVFGARQQRVSLMSNALALDADKRGTFDPVDLQQMSLESTTTQQLSEMQKRIFDSMRDSIQPWLQR